jgi:tripartite-type tricarboxylate transporter receptor subunit TctC
MSHTRRQLLRWAAAAAALPAVARPATAQAWPSRPVRWIVPFPPGGPTDIVARPLGQWLHERLGQPFVIDNRPGAGSNIGTEAAAKSPPDGYTLIMLGPSSAINATLYARLPFNVLHDIAPVAGLIRLPQVMAIHPSVPAKTVAEFIAYAKANPGKINYASPGNGTGPHLTAELFKLMTGIDMVHVPYRGVAPALTDLIAGQVQAMFVVPIGMQDHIKSGRLRALAVTTAARSHVFPDLPTIADTVAGYEASTWFGVGTPMGTPADVIGTLNREFNIVLAEPAMHARLAALGADTLIMTPAEFGRLLADETAKWAKVVKATGAKAN